MHFCVGDLVSIKKNKSEGPVIGLGIVVKKANPVQGLESSKHTQHILSSYSPVYYIYSINSSYNGPFQQSDLMLQQSYGLPINNEREHP